MPPRQRRTGYKGHSRLDPELEAALAAEAARLHAIHDAGEAVRSVSEFYDALEDALAPIAEARLLAVVELYEDLGSYARVGAVTGLSKTRVAQLYNEATRRGL